MADENPTTVGARPFRKLRRSEGKTALYRHFDKDGKLLYVGISLKWTSRTKEHQRSSSWFSQVSSITLQHFETLREALEAEKVAIMSENPVCNVMRDFVRRRKRADATEARKLPAQPHYPITLDGVRLRHLGGGLYGYDLPDIL
jgi:hypothetical protein